MVQSIRVSLARHSRSIDAIDLHERDKLFPPRRRFANVESGPFLGGARHYQVAVNIGESSIEFLLNIWQALVFARLHGYTSRAIPRESKHVS